MSYNSRRSDESGEVAMPAISVGKAKLAKRARMRLTLVLDDVHAIKTNESRLKQLYSLLKGCDEEGARIVLTSQVPLGELERRWSDTPELAAWVGASLKKVKLSQNKKENE